MFLFIHFIYFSYTSWLSSYSELHLVQKPYAVKIHVWHIKLKNVLLDGWKDGWMNN